MNIKFSNLVTLPVVALCSINFMAPANGQTPQDFPITWNLSQDPVFIDCVIPKQIEYPKIIQGSAPKSFENRAKFCATKYKNTNVTDPVLARLSGFIMPVEFGTDMLKPTQKLFQEVHLSNRLSNMACGEKLTKEPDSNFVEYFSQNNDDVHTEADCCTVKPISETDPSITVKSFSQYKAEMWTAVLPLPAINMIPGRFPIQKGENAARGIPPEEMYEMVGNTSKVTISDKIKSEARLHWGFEYVRDDCNTPPVNKCAGNPTQCLTVWYQKGKNVITPNGPKIKYADKVEFEYHN